MASETIRLSSDPGLWTDRQGTAVFTRVAFFGADMTPYWNTLVARITDDANGAGIGMDLSIISQLMGDQKTGLAIQNDSLRYQQLFRSPCAVASPKLRVLALAAQMDSGGNTPIEFLLEGSDVELITLYVVPGMPLPNTLPDHDIAIVLAPDDARSRETLALIDHLVPHWPRPMLNLPKHILGLDRHTLCRLLNSVPGLAIPITNRISRDELESLSRSACRLTDVLEGGAYPIIVRPVGSHAGLGLEKLDNVVAIAAYLETRPEDTFFISRFVDYASADGQFRKYRIVLVDGNAYACHMAISDQWKIWYLNAAMILNETNRAEEARFMESFDKEFGQRHRTALDEVARRIGVEYCTIDCADTRDGKLLIFEADNTAIVHDMDSVDLFPYKAPQMRKIFDAFVAMLYRHARKVRMRAA
jgi:hypothetical protein